MYALGADLAVIWEHILGVQCNLVMYRSVVIEAAVQSSNPLEIVELSLA